MKRKIVAALLATVMAMSVFTGCGSDKNDKQNTTSGDATSTGDSTSDGDAEITISASLDNLEEGEPTVSDPAYENDQVILGQYKGVEVTKVEVEPVTDEMVDEKVNDLLEENSTSKDVDVIEDGDTANIDYVGKIDGKEFDGGSDQGYDLKIGSGSFISGFEDGLIGAKKGSTVDVKVTFPDPYDNNPDLAGKDAVFTVTVNSITRDVLPELTDAFIKEKTDSETIEDYRETTRQELKSENEEQAEYTKQTSAWKVVVENSAIKVYDKDAVKDAAISYKKYMNSMMSMYGTSLSDYVTQMGSTMEEFDADAVEQGKLSEKEKMVMKAVAEKENITLTDDEYAAALKDTYEGYGYTTEDEFWKAVDERSIERADMEQNIRDRSIYNKVLKFVSDNAVEVEAATTDGDATSTGDAN